MLQTLKRLQGLLKPQSVPQSKTVSIVDFFPNSISPCEFKSCEDYLRTGSKKVWASFKACDIVANVVVSTPFTVTRRGATAPLDLTKQLQDLGRLLTYPNENQTFGDLLYLTSNYLKWVGNAYWLKSEATSKGDRPKDLYSLNPCRVRILPDKSGGILGYSYTRQSGGVVEFPAEDVMHFKRPHPLNDYYGMGDLEAGESLISDAANRSEFQKAFWKNGAAPSGAMVCEDTQAFTDGDAFKKAQRAWNAEFQGRENAGKIAWFGGKWRYERIGLTAQEMDDIDRLKLSTNQIFILHGVPLSVAGIEAAANLATATIDRQTFREQTVWPVVKIIQDTIQTDLITGWGANLELKFKLQGLINVGQIATDFIQLLDRAVITPNELRELIGYPRAENPMLDQHFINSALTPVDLAGVSNAQQVEQQAQRAVTDFVQKSLEPKTQ